MKWLLDGITDSMDTNMGKLWEMVRGRQAWRGAGRPGVPQSMRSQRVRLDSASEHMHTHDQEGVNSQKYINSSYFSTSEAQATWF